MKFLFFLITVNCCAFAGCGQQNTAKNVPGSRQELKAGGRCEGCEALYESSVPFEQLNSVDTLPGFHGAGPRIEISGTIYEADGRRPAAGVVLYIYHTDQRGVYPGAEAGKQGSHGTLRGWIKTDASGRYTFYTLVPASYPNSNNPRHIHAIIKEPGISEYWIDDFLFADDPLLPKNQTSKPRGGDGVLTTVAEGDLLKATRNIVLGKNIPGYPR